MLAVCTANICRSPAAAALLQRALSPILPGLSITSAGTVAAAGHPACDLSGALVGGYLAAYGPNSAESPPQEHRSRRVTADDLERSDLILALDRGHRAALARLLPSSRPRTFTLRQAGLTADRLAESLKLGDLPPGAPPMPDDLQQRFRWWVGELDAARAVIDLQPAAKHVPLAIDPLDIPDPHVVGYQYHPITIELVASCVVAITESLSALAEFGASAD